MQHHFYNCDRDVHPEVNKSTDEMETIYDDVTGEIKVKLWAHEYPIDTTCEIIEDLDFEDSKTEATFNKAQCVSRNSILNEYEIDGELSLEYINGELSLEYINGDTQIPKCIESVENFSEPMVSKYRIISESNAEYYASKDEKVCERVKRTNKEPCIKNESTKSTRTRFTAMFNPVSNKTSEPCIESNIDISKYLSKCEQTNHMCLVPADFQNAYLHTSDRGSQYLSVSKDESKCSFQYERRVNVFENQTLEAERTQFDHASSVRMSAFMNNHDYDWTGANDVMNIIHEEEHSVEPSNSLNQRTPYCKEKRASPASSSNYASPHQYSSAVSPFEENGDLVTKSQMYLFQTQKPICDLEEQKNTKKLKRGCRLWEYIRNLLLDPCTNPSLIRWEDRTEGTFKLVENKRIAYNWGMKKGNTDMSYEKLSRAMRYYYKKKIFQPVIGKRLVYKFGPCATGWKHDH